MAYIRIKKINNTPYAYLVESVNTSSGPRQKVKQYLGRVFSLEQKNKGSFVVSDSKNKKQLLQGLILSELEPRGFKAKDNLYCFDKVVFNPSSLTINKSSSNKSAVLALDNGYLCNFTLQRIIDFKKSKDFAKDGHVLAKYFLEAGLPIKEEDFVKFYQMI